jgi:hypothetical protein
LKKVKKQSDILVEALDNCKKASALLSGRWNDRSVAMFENGLEKAFKALGVYEKSLDDFSGALGSSNAACFFYRPKSLDISDISYLSVGADKK